MSRAPRAAVLLALAAVSSGCLEYAIGMDDEHPVVGPWVAIERTLVNAEDAGQSVELVARNWFRFMVFEDGGFTSLVDLEPAGDTLIEDQGEWVSERRTLTVRYEFSGETHVWSWDDPTETRLVIERDDGRPWDFDGDGTEEPTRESIILADARQSPDIEVVGEWSAVSWVLSSQADPSTAVNLVDMGGALDLTLVQVGIYDFTRTRPDGDGGTTTAEGSGEYAAVDGFLWLIEGGTDVRFLGYDLDGDALVITGDDEAWDFDGDGTAEPANVVIRLSPAA